MSELWTRASDATNRKLRELYAADQSAVSRKLKELWARDASAVNRKIFSGAITWAYVVAGGTGPYYGNSQTASAYAGADGSSQAGNTCVATVDYTFSSPLVMKVGDSLKIINKILKMQSALYYVYVDGTNICSQKVLDEEDDFTYTFPTNTQVTTIRTAVQAEVEFGGSYPLPESDLMVTVNSSEYGSFLLNNSGTSDQ